jgi:hypothetical protein
VELWKFYCEYKRRRITARRGSYEERVALEEV